MGDKDLHPIRLLVALVMGVGFYALAGLLPFVDPSTATGARMAAGVTALVATCWLTDALPLGAASLLPMPLFAALGVLSFERAATAYAHPIIWLFFGGFVLALGVERWGLHRRLALAVIARAGTRPAALVLAFMIAAALLSMWLSNTATALLLLPIATALIESLREAGGVSGRYAEGFAISLLLGIAYGCSIGGVGTPIGTPPNAIFLSLYAPYVKAGAPAMGFVAWMSMAMPFVIVMVPLAAFLLTRVLSPVGPAAPGAADIIRAKAQALGPMTRAEWRMLALFGLAALLWITRRDFDLGELGSLPGWWRLLPISNAESIGDGAVAVFVALLGFVVPSGRKRGEALMSWDVAKKVPWQILFLFGGGIAIARAFSASGLADALAHALEPYVHTLPVVPMVLLVSVLTMLFTEVTSNTAVTALLLPILASTAVAAEVDPRLLMLPATLSASCAFMLPIATPPNAIVFASGEISMRRMARNGALINLVAALLITLLIVFVATPLLGIELGSLPTWAQSVTP